MWAQAALHHLTPVQSLLYYPRVTVVEVELARYDYSHYLSVHITIITAAAGFLWFSHRSVLNHGKSVKLVIFVHVAVA